jgi:hypothetical protein
MPRAIIPPSVMTPDGRYDDRWKRWCLDHGVSLLAFVREAQRRQARF